MTYCWIAQGKLFFCTPAGVVREHQSEFGREAVQRAEEQKRHHGWKAKPGAQEAMVSRRMLWGQQGAEGGPSTPPRFLAVLSGKDADEIYYVLGMSHSCGLFRYHFSDNTEYRLFHRQEFVQHGLVYDPSAPGLVVSLVADDGSASLWELTTEGRQGRKLTDGDVIDSTPSISRSQSSRVLYESTGIGRDQQGHVMGHAATAILSLDRDTGTITTLKEDPQRDFLQPSQDGAGILYYIRRPHRGHHQASAWTLAQDFLLFPVRLCVAGFHFLNTFSMMFSKKPLRTSGPQRPFDARGVMIKGQWMDAERAARLPVDQRSLVPASWELVACDAAHQERVLARKVASYWLEADGTILTTDGFTIHRHVQGTPSVVSRSDLVEQITVCA